MRAIRGRAGVFAAAVLAGALILSALAGLGSRRQPIPDEGPWTIGLSYPEGDWSTCLDDPSLEDAIMTADLPVSSVTVRTVEGAAVTDVRRVLVCLSAGMTGGTVQVAGS